MTEDDLEQSVTPEIVDTNELTVMVNNSGLEKNKANFMLEQFTEHYKMAAEWAKKAKSIVVTNENQTVNMQMARTGRLFLRAKRIEIENARKALKEQSLKEGKAIDMIANFLKDLIIPTEEHLDRQEHFVEYKKKAEEDRLLAEAQAKAEADRIAKEEADRKALALAQEENAKLRKQQEEERIKNQLEADKLRKENESKLAKERLEREKLEEELRQKKQAELKAEADRLKAQELKKLAGDNDKLIELHKAIASIEIPEVKSKDALRMVANADNHLRLALKSITIQEQE